MERFLAVVLAIASVIHSFPAETNPENDQLVSMKFDFGGEETAEGYTGVSAGMQGLCIRTC